MDHYRKTPKNRYEIVVNYQRRRGDGRELQAGKVKVVGVNLRPADPVLLFPTLQDLPEVATLCPSGCGIFMLTGGDLVMVYPRTPDEQRHDADALEAYRWKGEPYEPPSPDLLEKQAPFQGPALLMHQREHYRDMKLDRREVNWTRRRVIWVTMGLSPVLPDLQWMNKHIGWGGFKLGSLLPAWSCLKQADTQ